MLLFPIDNSAQYKNLTSDDLTVVVRMQSLNQRIRFTRIGIYPNLRKCSISSVCSTRSLRVAWSIASEIALAEQRLSKRGSADYHKPTRKLHREWIARHDREQHNSRITASAQRCGVLSRPGRGRMGEFNSAPKFGIYRARYAVSRVRLLGCDAHCFANLLSCNRAVRTERRSTFKHASSRLAQSMRKNVENASTTWERQLQDRALSTSSASAAKTDLAFNGATLLNSCSHPISLCAWRSGCRRKRTLTRNYVAY